MQALTHQLKPQRFEAFKRSLNDFFLFPEIKNKLQQGQHISTPVEALHSKPIFWRCSNHSDLHGEKYFRIYVVCLV